MLREPDVKRSRNVPLLCGGSTYAFAFQSSQFPQYGAFGRPKTEEDHPRMDTNRRKQDSICILFRASVRVSRRITPRSTSPSLRQYNQKNATGAT